VSHVCLLAGVCQAPPPLGSQASSAASSSAAAAAEQVKDLNAMFDEVARDDAHWVAVPRALHPRRPNDHAEQPQPPAPAGESKRLSFESPLVAVDQRMPAVLTATATRYVCVLTADSARLAADTGARIVEAVAVTQVRGALHRGVLIAASLWVPRRARINSCPVVAEHAVTATRHQAASAGPACVVSPDQN
jgi:hypothetical protein